MKHKTIERLLFVVAMIAVCGLGFPASAAEAAYINESARDIPIAHEVDVAVVGGGTGAVAAAIEAAKAGASVFLAAPYPYLGDDMTSTLRLWLEEDEMPEHPLAQKLFFDELQPSSGALRFSYETDRSSVEPHADTDPPTLLTNRRWGAKTDGLGWERAHESVKYDGDVTITAELEEEAEVDKVRIIVYRTAVVHRFERGGIDWDLTYDYNVGNVEVSISDDGQSWEPTAVVEGQAAMGEEFYILEAPVQSETRYVRLNIAKAEDAEGILLGEIELLAPRTSSVTRPFLPSVMLRSGGLEFTYETDIPSAAPHTDTDPPRRLTDGRWGSASSESVQYNGDVTITADLGEITELQEAHLVVYRRDETTDVGTGFNVERMRVSISNDRESWEEAAEIAGQPGSGQDYYVLSIPMAAETRYVRLELEKPAQYERILLGELQFHGPSEEDFAPLPMVRPMHIKKTLDEALLEAGVEYLYSSVVTDVLRDAAGEPAGIVMANRSGRQAVVAKTIIDATHRGQVARMAGARFLEYPAGRHTFRRTVIGGEAQEGESMEAREVGAFFEPGGGMFPVIEYTLELPMDDASHASWMKADQEARTKTYHPDQQWTSDVLFQIPPDALYSRQPVTGAYGSAGELSLGALEPDGVRGVYVLGGCADVPREEAGKLMRPLELIDLGARVGEAAAEQAHAMASLEDVSLPGEETLSPLADGDVQEPLDGLRPAERAETPVVAQQARTVPVLGEYDVVVIGGGTSGSPAGIAAARQGANVLVVEYLHGLGGVGTEGAISRYHWGNRVGFTADVMNDVRSWHIERRKEWWRSALLEAGADIWFGSLGAGAFVDDGRVAGAVVVTPQERGVILANTVIDATGNSDVAAAAGAPTDYTDAYKAGMQGAGLPGRRLGESYNNSDFTIMDETDILDVWHVLVYSKGKYPDAFDHGRLLDTRERRRIMGDIKISVQDQLIGRTYPDTVVQTYSNYDSHAFTDEPYYFIQHPERRGIAANVPYRAMLPQGLDGILVVGLGISAHRDAVGPIRMQPGVQNGGYAAGLAAAMAAESGVAPRDIDVRALQEHLVEIGNLPEEVLGWEDSYPMPLEEIEAAVASISDENDFVGAAVAMLHPAEALPFVKEAYHEAEGRTRVTYAKLLAVLGSSEGLETLLEELHGASEWDEGWHYRGMGQFGPAHSELDALITVIGKTGSTEAVPPILELAGKLGADVAFSHHRAVGRALELIGDPAAAEPLARLLAKPGMSGNHHPDIHTAIEREAPGGTNAVSTRRESYREILLARALYRCGDHEGVGRTILENYTQDLRGHFARHARAVLEEE